MELTLGEVRDWLKGLCEADRYYIGRLDGARTHALGVYPRTRRGAAGEALGGAATYGVKPVTILLRWDENAAETEAAALGLWRAVLSHRGGAEDKILFVRPAVSSPVSVGADQGGVYEYVIDLDIYFRR